MEFDLALLTPRTHVQNEEKITLKQMFDITAQTIHNDEEIYCLDKIVYQKNLEFFIVKSVTADGSLRSPTAGVEGIDPAPHIHEQFTIQKWLRMATTLRTPLRITTSRLSTMR